MIYQKDIEPISLEIGYEWLARCIFRLEHLPHKPDYLNLISGYHGGRKKIKSNAFWCLYTFNSMHSPAHAQTHTHTPYTYTTILNIKWYLKYVGHGGSDPQLSGKEL